MTVFHELFPYFEEDPSSNYDCENLHSIELVNLVNEETIHLELDVDKISHINSVYENNIFKYFEIVYIDSNQVTIKEFDSEELANAWIAKNFEII